MPRLIPSILMKNEEKITCTPRKSSKEKTITERTWSKGPKSLAAHFHKSQNAPPVVVLARGYNLLGHITLAHGSSAAAIEHFDRRSRSTSRLET